MMITGCASCWVPLSRLPHSAIALDKNIIQIRKIAMQNYPSKL